MEAAKSVTSYTNPAQISSFWRPQIEQIQAEPNQNKLKSFSHLPSLDFL